MVEYLTYKTIEGDYKMYEIKLLPLLILASSIIFLAWFFFSTPPVKEVTIQIRVTKVMTGIMPKNTSIQNCIIE